MQSPASPPKPKRTCPTCNSPVGPGDKFCEICGTRVPELLTCSKCGTQFITPLKYCDLCGTRLIPEEAAGPDNSPELSREEKTGPIEDQAPEQEEELPEPHAAGLPGGIAREALKPAKAKTPHQYTREIREPDTDELLERYGKDYDPDETLESARKPKSTARKKQEPGKPATVPAQPRRGSKEPVDNALFLFPEKPEAPAKPRANRTKIIGGCIALIAIIAAVYFIGLPLLAESGGSGVQSSVTVAGSTSLTEPTGAGTATPTAKATSAPAPAGLVPQPTQTLPTGQKLYFQVQKSPITTKILIIFAGSAGHGSISSADITVTHPDGSVTTGIILPLKGITEIILDGSKGTDRVEIIAQMTEGGSYRVYDELVPPLT